MLDRREQLADQVAPQDLGMMSQGGERRCRVAGRVNVIETDDAQIPGHVNIARRCSPERTDGQ